MVEPDFDKPRPDSCYDVLILYATTEQTDYEPLTQTAIELSPYLSTRGPNVPDVRSLFNPLNSQGPVTKLKIQEKNSQFYFVKYWKTSSTMRKYCCCFHLIGHTVGFH